MSFQNETPRAGLSLTLGTEVSHLRDVAVAYGTLANEGRHISYTHVLHIADSSGTDLVDPYVPPAGEAVVSPQAAYVMTNILDSNTRPAQNPIWGDFELENAGGQHRPATLKTGTKTTPTISWRSATSRRLTRPAAPRVSTRWSLARGAATATARPC